MEKSSFVTCPICGKQLTSLSSKHLKNIGLETISQYILSECSNYTLQQRWGGKISDRKIFEDPRYDKLLNGKYKFCRSQFIIKNFIREDIILLANNRFLNIADHTLIKHTDQELIDAVLDFYLKAVV